MVLMVIMFTMERCRSKWFKVISWLEQLNLEDNSCLHSDIGLVVRMQMTKMPFVQMVRMATLLIRINHLWMDVALWNGLNGSPVGVRFTWSTHSGNKNDKDAYQEVYQDTCQLVPHHGCHHVQDLAAVGYGQDARQDS